MALSILPSGPEWESERDRAWHLMIDAELWVIDAEHAIRTAMTADEDLFHDAVREWTEARTACAAATAACNALRNGLLR